MVCMGWWIAGCSLWCTVDTTFSCVLVCSSWFILRWDEQANVLYICDFPKFGWAPCVYGILWTTIRSELWWLLCGQQRSCCAASRTLVSGKNASWTTGWRIRRRNRFFGKAGRFFGKAWPKSKTWRCQLWQFRTLAELGAKSIRTRVLLKSCMLSLKHMVRMCRTCHRPVQKISGKAKPCQRGIKLSFLLEFQVESLRCQSRRDMERCQKWKRLDKRNHTIVSQHHISFSTVFWQAVRANPPFTTGARNNKARLTALVEKDQSAQSIDPAACLKHAQTASHFASIYIDWSIIALEVWKYLEFSLRFEHVQKHSKTFFFCFTCFPFHDFMTSFFLSGVGLRRVVAALDEVLKSGENPLDFREPLALDFLPTTLIQELHVVNTSDKICIHPFFSMLLDETWMKKLLEILKWNVFVCFWSEKSITFASCEKPSRNDWSWEDVWPRASSQKSTSMARPSSVKDGELKAHWFEVRNILNVFRL